MSVDVVDVMDVSVEVEVFGYCYLVDGVELRVDVEVVVGDGELLCYWGVFDKDVVVGSIVGGFDVIVDDGDGGGFICFVGVKESKDFVVGDIEGDIVDCSVGVEGFGEVDDVEVVGDFGVIIGGWGFDMDEFVGDFFIWYGGCFIGVGGFGFGMEEEFVEVEFSVVIVCLDEDEEEDNNLDDEVEDRIVVLKDIVGVRG